MPALHCLNGTMGPTVRAILLVARIDRTEDAETRAAVWPGKEARETPVRRLVVVAANTLPALETGEAAAGAGDAGAGGAGEAMVVGL